MRGFSKRDASWFIAIYKYVNGEVIEDLLELDEHVIWKDNDAKSS